MPDPILSALYECLVVALPVALVVLVGYIRHERRNK